MKQRYPRRRPKLRASEAKRPDGPRPIYPSDLGFARPTYALLRAARDRAKAAGEVFAISEADIHIPDVCPATGLSLYIARGKRGGTDHSPSLDLIDPARGWIPGNVIVVSMFAKRIMGPATLAELQAIVAFFASAQADASDTLPVLTAQ